jgi:hypothetical protein
LSPRRKKQRKCRDKSRRRKSQREEEYMSEEEFKVINTSQRGESTSTPSNNQS